MPTTSLQTLLGHASIATTRDIYAPRTPDEKLLDEMRTYSRDPKTVAQEGARQIRHEARASKTPKVEKPTAKGD